MSFESSEPFESFDRFEPFEHFEPSEPIPLDWRRYRHISHGDHDRKAYEADLVQLGYNESKVRQFVGGKTAVANDLLANLAPKFDENRKARYHDLRLDTETDRKTENWVFFDPFTPSINEILSKVDKDDMPIVIKFAFYKPQNGYYLEYNTISKAIRMKSAGNGLEGKHLDYTSNGVVFKKDDGSNDPEIVTKVEIMDTDEVIAHGLKIESH